MVLNIYKDDNGFSQAEVWESDIPDIQQAESARMFYIKEDNLDPDNVRVVQYKE